MERYLAGGSHPVRCDEDEIARMNVVPIASDLVPDDEEFSGRHDPTKLGQMVLFLANGVTGGRELAGKSHSWVA